MWCSLDLVVLGLPDADDLHVQSLEEEPAMEAQGPEDELVVFDALEGQVGVAEDDILAVNGVYAAEG